MHVHSPNVSAPRTRGAVAILLAFVLAAWNARDATAGAPGLDDHQEASSESASSVRTATDDELKELEDDFKSAWKEKESRAIAAALERMSVFSNPELLEAAEDALEYEASKSDRADVVTEAKALDMNTPLARRRMLEVRIAKVIEAASRVCVAVGDEDSVELLVDALTDKQIEASPPQIRAVVDALAAHRLASEKADEAVAAILYSIDADDYAGNKFDFDRPDEQVSGYDYVARYSAVIRYFGVRRTKSFDVLTYVAGLLNAPAPGSVDAPNNPPASYWKSRFQA
jgi:5'-3' exonuclease